LYDAVTTTPGDGVMKVPQKIAVVALLALLAGASTGMAAQLPPAAGDAATAQRRAHQVRGAFERWLAGSGFFDQLPAPDARWIVRGSGDLARTYSGREEYLRGFVRPFAARLTAPVKPTVRRLVAQDDVVVALWDGEATARDGVPYRNHYVWAFRFEGDEAVEVEIFLDLATYQGVIDRVPGAP
jgi:ketosteroid isomerase-like protein